MMPASNVNLNVNPRNRPSEPSVVLFAQSPNEAEQDIDLLSFFETNWVPLRRRYPT